MVFLLLVSLHEFKQFLQIVFWIAVPATIVSVVITTWLHYRRKKKSFYPEAEPVALPQNSFRLAMSGSPAPLPDWLASSQPDNTSLLKKYEQELRHSKEQYTILEQDFKELENKYSDLLNKAYNDERPEKAADERLLQEIKGYKLKIAQLQQALDFKTGNSNGEDKLPPEDWQVTIQHLEEALRQLQEQEQIHTGEISRLEECLRETEQLIAADRQEKEEHLQLIQQLREENTQLKQQLRAGHENTTLTDPEQEQRIQELQQLLTAAEEEKLALKSRLADQEYLQDILQEKKLQTDFLQNQLDQRIKNYHQLEMQAGETTSQLQQLQNTAESYNKKVQVLKEELQQKHQEIADWRTTLESNREESRQQQEAIREKIEHIEKLEFNLQELQQQQAALQSVIDDKQDTIMLLQNSIEQEQQRAKDMESKLELSSRLLINIYSELAKSFNNGLVQLQNGKIPALISKTDGGNVTIENPAEEEVTTH